MSEKNHSEQKYIHVCHTFGPVWDAESEILILGSFPSVKSREQQFYYGHPQNRFWKVMAAVLGTPVPDTVDEKKEMLLFHHIALWDVIAECDIIGSGDSTIRNVIPNDLSGILKNAPVRRICTNGGTAGRLYSRFQKPYCGVESICLPSTSPANAAWRLPALAEAWKTAICSGTTEKQQDRRQRFAVFEASGRAAVGKSDL